MYGYKEGNVFNDSWKHTVGFVEFHVLKYTNYFYYMFVCFNDFFCSFSICIQCTLYSTYISGTFSLIQLEI